MRHPILPVILFCANLTIASGVSFSAVDTIDNGADRQMIKKEDILHIKVMGSEELTTNAVVDNGGFINFPLIKEVNAENMTIQEFTNVLEARLSEFIRYPRVTVNRESVRNAFFVYGEVHKPGEYELKGRIDVLKAITIAGGFTDFASHNVKIIKHSSKRTDIWVNVDGIIKGKGKNRDVLVEQGNIIVVPESLF
ncbi:MAG: polysaccharide biosynthesis/export family protein [Candidatus Omnitrophota bacterium]|nr:polysaccharide biosynthesis/export family protein [Candidatus Omnitrophota bacterium]